MNKRTFSRLALKKQLEEQRQQAELLKSAEQTMPKLPPIFEQLEVRGYAESMQRFELVAVKTDSFAKPFIITDFLQSEAGVKWQSDKASQGYITKWASTYKKHATFQRTHKLAQPIDDTAICALTDVTFTNSFRAIKDKVDFRQELDFHTQPLPHSPTNRSPMDWKALLQNLCHNAWEWLICFSDK